MRINFEILKNLKPKSLLYYLKKKLKKKKKMALKENLSLPNDGIRIQTANTRAFIADRDYGIGILCVSERFLIFCFFFVFNKKRVHFSKNFAAIYFGSKKMPKVFALTTRILSYMQSLLI